MRLKNLQDNFAKHLCDESHTEILKTINCNSLNATTRMRIYRHNVFGALEATLALTYKVCQKIVGEDYFLFLSQKYIEKYKSTSGNLEDYGEYFADFVKENEDKHQLFYLSDICRLEWLYNLSYLSENSKTLDIKALQNISKEDLMKISFQINKSCYILKSNYPIFSIWKMNHDNTNEKINLEEKKAESILLVRNKSKIDLFQIGNSEFQFINMSQKGKMLFEIYEEISKNIKNIDIGALINQFITGQIITNFVIKDD